MSKLIGFILLLAAASAVAGEVAAPVGVEDLLSGNYREARGVAEVAVEEVESPDPKLAAVLAVTHILESRHASILANAKKLIGKTVTLATTKSTVKGRVASVTEDNISLTVQLVINKQVVGESRRKIKWTNLAPAEIEKLAGAWQPPGADGHIARAVLALVAGDSDAAEEAVKNAPDHVLASYVVGKIEAKNTPSDADGTGAAKAWAKIESKYKLGSSSVAAEIALSKEVRRFRAKHGELKLDVDLRKRIDQVLARVKKASGLVGHWDFDDGKGTTARDSSGNKNDAVLTGGQWVKGRTGGAFRTTAQGDRVTVSRNPTLDLPSAITVALWVNISGVAFDGYADLVRKSNYGGSGYNMRWSHRNGRLRWAPRAGALRVDDTGRNSTYHNAWHHICGTYDGTTGVARLYVDGVERNRTRGNPTGLTHSGDLFLLVADYAKQATVLGAVDDVRIYHRAISVQEIAVLVRGR